MADELLRVVVVRKGKVKPTEFRLREGEAGLSLFRAPDDASCEAILNAVRAAGKQGELALAEIPASTFHALGLKLVPTPGGTPDADVNALHYEARPTRWRQFVLWLRRKPLHDWFNETVTPHIATAAKLTERGTQ